MRYGVCVSKPRICSLCHVHPPLLRYWPSLAGNGIREEQGEVHEELLQMLVSVDRPPCRSCNLTRNLRVRLSLACKLPRTLNESKVYAD